MRCIFSINRLCKDVFRTLPKIQEGTFCKNALSYMFDKLLNTPLLWFQMYDIHHRVKSVLIRSYSGPPFPVFELNTQRYEVSLRIQSECRKMRTRITPNTVFFHADHTIRRIFNLGRCFAYGDPHFKTFDNKWFDFNGICKYVLAKDYVTNLFDIIIENVACNQLNDVSCAKSVTVSLNGTNIMLNQYGRVSVNDTSVKLPYMGPGVLIRKVCNTFSTLNAMLN